MVRKKSKKPDNSKTANSRTSNSAVGKKGGRNNIQSPVKAQDEVPEDDWVFEPIPTGRSLYMTDLKKILADSGASELIKGVKSCLLMVKAILKNDWVSVMREGTVSYLTEMKEFLHESWEFELREGIRLYLMNAKSGTESKGGGVSRSGKKSKKSRSKKANRGFVNSEEKKSENNAVFTSKMSNDNNGSKTHDQDSTVELSESFDEVSKEMFACEPTESTESTESWRVVERGTKREVGIDVKLAGEKDAKDVVEKEYKHSVERDAKHAVKRETKNVVQKGSNEKNVSYAGKKSKKSGSGKKRKGGTKNEPKTGEITIVTTHSTTNDNVAVKTRDQNSMKASADASDEALAFAYTDIKSAATSQSPVKLSRTQLRRQRKRQKKSNKKWTSVGQVLFIVWCSAIFFVVKMPVKSLIIKIARRKIIDELQVNVYGGSTECDDSEKVRAGQYLSIHFNGSIHEYSPTEKRGSEFGNTRSNGDTFNFLTGSGGVIKALDEGLFGLCKGAKAILHVPAEYGYGTKGAGDAIPINATLKFDLEIVDISDGSTISHERKDFFSIMDKDKSGYLTKEEVYNWFRSQGEKDIPLQFMESEDANQDGVISWDEFSGPKGKKRGWVLEP